MDTRFVDMAQFAHAWCDVEYAHESPSQKMDIVLPEQGEGPFPIVFFLHGGGWVGGDKRAAMSAAWLFRVLHRGYALASVNYRLASEAYWPAPVLDAKAALRCLKARADEFGIDAERIVVWGNSAGGHVANMLCATAASGLFEDKGMGAPEQTCEVKALVDLFSPSDIYQLDLADRSYNDPITLDMLAHCQIGPFVRNDATLNTPHAREMGFVPRFNEDASVVGSPICYVDATFPPALYQHGTCDHVVPYTQSTTMVRRINDVCGEGRAAFELFDNADHGAPVFKTDDNMNHLLDFFDTILFGAPRGHVPLPDVEMI